MVTNQAKGFGGLEYREPNPRVRGLIADELARLLASGGARPALVELAGTIHPRDVDAVQNLALLADAAWVTAADQREYVDLGGAMRIEQLTRAASLATLLRIHLELLGCENVGAERALNLAEELARGDVSFKGDRRSEDAFAEDGIEREPDAPLPRSSSSRESTGWRAHVQALSAWLKR